MEMKILAPAAAAAVIIIALFAYAAINQSPGTGFRGYVKAYYDAAPRDENNIVNKTELLRLLKNSHVNTYNFLIRLPDEDFQTLKDFLPMAREAGIDVWVTVAPPLGMPPEKRADIRYVDYIGWGRKFANLSLEHDNLVAWSIDNIIVERSFFTTGYVESIVSSSKNINPKLKFIPVVYYGDVASPYFDDMKQFFDGVQFYYTHFPQGPSDESSVLLTQLNELKSKFDKPIFLGIYATPFSNDIPTSPEYVGQMMDLAEQHTDGAMIYTLNLQGEKLETVKMRFAGK